MDDNRCKFDVRLLGCIVSSEVLTLALRAAKESMTLHKRSPEKV